MASKVFTGSNFVETRPKYWSGSAWLVPVFVKVWDGAAWVNVFVRFTASASPTTLNGASSFTGVTWVGQVGPATATPSDGIAPYTYSWRRIAGSATILAVNPNAQSTDFQFNSSVQTGNATFVCDVTDNAANSFTTNTVTVSFS